MNTTEHASRAADLPVDAGTLYATVTGNGWVTGGLRTGGGCPAIGAEPRAVDRLTAAGLGQLVHFVEPLQQVHDRMAYNAPMIQTCADAWTRAADEVEEVAVGLTRQARGSVADWEGGAGSKYRARADEIAAALIGSATTFAALGAATLALGEVAADARRQVGDLLNRLVDDLIGYTQTAVAVQGGITPEVLASNGNLVAIYAKPIAALEQGLVDSGQGLVAPESDGGVEIDLDTVMEVVSWIPSPVTAPIKLWRWGKALLRGARYVFRLRRDVTPTPPSRPAPTAPSGSGTPSRPGGQSGSGGGSTSPSGAAGEPPPPAAGGGGTTGGGGATGGGGTTGGGGQPPAGGGRPPGGPPRPVDPLGGKVTYGKNAVEKMRSHAQDIRVAARAEGVEIPKGVTKPETQQAMRGYIENVVRNPEQVATGRYMSYDNAIYSGRGDLIVVRQSNGEFVTVLRNSGGGAAGMAPWNIPKP